ncbi:helix-turn-helix domain-containing protein [Flavihumibacter petaseus]|uniref:Putative Xre family transcriptional regulator n=1 Tax=Flavihumibacter petaseus NBRC 106054 TaxID=1220578 RepID=A0A0E9N4M3_9BACT|nr:XRE family transcriptional regulator [Flavihumibacter petaseus]GAO44621.1 putative Xre family transcriptional regulator [Flavihumibacter petaseus NBRC 106054]
MQEDILIQISNKIKETRRNKNITVQQLATQANVSKGLISQIENNRTVPSLPVLMSIVQSLGLDLTEFFNGIQANGGTEKIVIKRSADYKHFKKETAKGFDYQRIFTRNMAGGAVDFVLLKLKKGANRSQMVKTDAYEYKYIIQGTVEYLIEEKVYTLQEGDSLFFDGRLGHKPANIGKTDALILVVYFFQTNS